MKRLQLEWGWKFATLMFILTIVICGFSFDMIAHWDTKKKRREDLKIMLLVIGIYGIIVLFFTVDFQLVVFNTVLIAVLVISGWLASEPTFNDPGKSKPWELYFIAIVSLLVLIGSVVWAYFYTKGGKYLRKKGKHAKDKYRELRQDRRERQDRNRQVEENRLKQKSRDEYANPIYDENTDYTGDTDHPVPAPRTDIRRRNNREALFDTSTTGTESD